MDQVSSGQAVKHPSPYTILPHTMSGNEAPEEAILACLGLPGMQSFIPVPTHSKSLFKVSAMFLIISERLQRKQRKETQLLFML